MRGGRDDGLDDGGELLGARGEAARLARHAQRGRHDLLAHGLAAGEVLHLALLKKGRMGGRGERGDQSKDFGAEASVQKYICTYI